MTICKTDDIKNTVHAEVSAVFVQDLLEQFITKDTIILKKKDVLKYLVAIGKERKKFYSKKYGGKNV